MSHNRQPYTRPALERARFQFSQDEPERCSTCLAPPPPEREWLFFTAPHVRIFLCDRCLDYFASRPWEPKEATA